MKNPKTIFPPGLFHQIYVSVGIHYRGGILNFWKNGFELQVLSILGEESVKEYLLQVIFRCYEDKKYFNVFINTKNTTKGSSVVFDALQSIKGIINKFCMNTTSNEVNIELEEYGLHPEHDDYEPLSIERIKVESSLSDRSLHINNNPFYFGVENCIIDGINSLQSYCIADEEVDKMVRRESEQPLVRDMQV